MLHVVTGVSSNHLAVKQLSDVLKSLTLTGTLYFGYPVLATADTTIIVDALMVCVEHGLILFRFISPVDADPDRIMADYDELTVSMQSKLNQNRDLRERTRLLVPVTVILFCTGPVPHLAGLDDVNIANASNLSSLITSLEQWKDTHVFSTLTSVVDRVAKIKPTKKRIGVVKPDSRGAKIKEIEKQISNLDEWQRDAVISHPEGIQRIGGLAGSGKTVVLALKAAYLHATNPQWVIGVTFYTQALYQQFKDLIRRFTYEHTQDEPDWEKVRILHCWGGFSREGICFDVAQRFSLPILDFSTAKSEYGMDKAFAGTCSELLTSMASVTDPEIYDVLLIDESQDLPQPFFEIAYTITKSPKRLVYAYDDLQNLGDQEMAPPEEMFGVVNGRPRVMSQQIDDQLLPVCYRNTPWALATAHALGLGVYRQKSGLIQSVEDPKMWERIGYEISGEYSQNSLVSLRRRSNATPTFFQKLIAKADAVVVHCARTVSDEALWVANSIHNDIKEQELEPSDILVVLPDALTAQKDAAPIIHHLQQLGVQAHLAGVTTDRDVFFRENSVALAHIYRAKGNEAPMVYVIGAQFAYNFPSGLAKRRNRLFTAITRSRAWVRISGSGAYMTELEKEIRKVESNDYQLNFKVPTKAEMADKRRLYRELTRQQAQQLGKTSKTLVEYLELVDRNELSIQDLPPSLLEQLKKHFER